MAMEEQREKRGRKARGEGRGTRLFELRRAALLSQKQLASGLGVAQNTISQWENGVREIDVNSIRNICEYFGISANYLLRIPVKWSDKQYEEYAELDNKGRADMLIKRGCPDDIADIGRAMELPRDIKGDDELSEMFKLANARPDILRLMAALMRDSKKQLDNIAQELSKD